MRMAMGMGMGRLGWAMGWAMGWGKGTGDGDGDGDGSWGWGRATRMPKRAEEGAGPASRYVGGVLRAIPFL